MTREAADGHGAARLATLIYDAEEGRVADAVLAEAASLLVARGHRLAGTIQKEPCTIPTGRCPMLLHDLASGRDIDIAEDRGPEARGCRLNADALETAVVLSLAAIERDPPDVLIVNKFGRHEAEGRGFRPAIALALEKGIPVVLAVSRLNEAAWGEFVGGMDVRLRLLADDVVRWAESVAPPAAGAVRRSAAE